ncbi:inositol monophosphatase family protein [Mycolicibacterium chitae]|uniref:inositol monophosphatase family protein n=1 Tax=Mycolicibacterium chitae TaxID=1792 RepID=UPI000F826CE3|nr:inositol monophosphatase family protein [Mycolicibacterium chitae]MCV7108044.1 inositol monophosphatase [Mycolicibacterium chitae]
MCCDGTVINTALPAGQDVATLRRVAEALAAEAAEFVRTRRAEVFVTAPVADAVAAKSDPTDPVTIVDTETEALLRARLAELRPGDAILGEEGGGPAQAAAPGAVTWVLDPIDGTVNFVYGIPAYAVSVAAQVDGVSVAGAVAHVSTGEIYSAATGLGAHVTGGGGTVALRCSAVSELGMALVGTGFDYSARRRTEQARLLAALLPTVRDIRRIGSAALDLCLVAAGRLDAHYEHELHAWDWAAGALIAAEAGATVLVPEPGAGSGTGLVVASAPGVADALRAELQRLGAFELLSE